MKSSNFAILVPNDLGGSWIIDEQGNETKPNTNNERLTEVLLFKTWKEANDLRELKGWFNTDIEQLTFDVELNDNEASDRLGISASFEHCKWIIDNKESSKFADYIGGIAQIKCNEIETPDESFYQKSI